MKDGRENVYSHASTVEIISSTKKEEENGTTINKYSEELIEQLVPIDKCKDDLIKLFIKLHSSMPELDHITANKRIKSEGSLKRLLEMIPRPSFGQRNADTKLNNIFAPTAAL